MLCQKLLGVLLCNSWFLAKSDAFLLQNLRHIEFIETHCKKISKRHIIILCTTVDFAQNGGIMRCPHFSDRQEQITEVRR